jgi:hypothetical protein
MKRIAVRVILLGFGLAAGSADAVIVFNDGGIHEISTTVYEDIHIYDGPGGAPTLIRLLAGAETDDVVVFQNSRFEMTAGEIEDGTLSLYDHGQAELSGGRVSDDSMRIFDFSRLIITGGDIGPGFRSYGNSEVFIYGSDFQIDGVPVGYGRISIPMGVLAGDLLDGQMHTYTFLILDDSSVTLVPEPASAIMLGLGGVALILRRKAPDAQNRL